MVVVLVGSQLLVLRSRNISAPYTSTERRFVLSLLVEESFCALMESFSMQR